ncbi:hypothetical protein FACS189431_8840 [Alphaproteobacteria bacterium]|nr:hypothetical protein FACS189431_8840 [Alphaproteobacteria bacterium]
MAKKLHLPRNKRPLLIVVAVILAIIVIFAIWLGVNTGPRDPNNTDGVKIDIRTGASVEEVSATLAAKNLIRDSLAFSIYTRLTFTKIEAGSHFIAPSMSAAEIAAVLRSAGNPTYNLTILPEQTIPDTKATLLKYDFSATEIDAALNKNYDHPLLVGKPDGFDLEGYIFPDTYEMHTSDTVEDLLVRTFDNLYDKLKTDGSLAYMATRDLSIYETLTLASIVAKEVPGDDDQKVVAGVFWNRLDWDLPLGSDVTFKYAYAMGYCAADSPSCASAYNTRIHRGLPPGPISNMKYSTIQAVLHPTDSDYFYFVAGDDGRTYFARTEDEHQANVANYCHKLCY